MFARASTSKHIPWESKLCKRGPTISQFLISASIFLKTCWMTRKKQVRPKKVVVHLQALMKHRHKKAVLIKKNNPKRKQIWKKRKTNNHNNSQNQVSNQWTSWRVSRRTHLKRWLTTQIRTVVKGPLWISSQGIDQVQTFLSSHLIKTQM